MKNQEQQATLRRLDDLYALEKLINIYQEYCDDRNWDGYGSCYTEDAVVVVKGGTSGPICGRAAIVEMAVQSFFAHYQVTQHLITNLNFELIGADSATGRGETILVALAEERQTPDIYITGGRYRWQFRRTAAGWKFAHYEVGFVWSRGRLVDGIFAK